MTGILYRAVLDIKTDISESSIRGDTLFGLLCVSILEHEGKDRLTELLKGYTGDDSGSKGDPFAIISDSLPHVPQDKNKVVAIPLATVPNDIYHKIEKDTKGKKEEITTDRKLIKKLKYVTSAFLKSDYRDWLKKIHINDQGEEKKDKLITDLNENSGAKSYTTVGNVIDRSSGTTLEGGLFQIKRNTFSGKQVIYIYVKQGAFPLTRKQGQAKKPYTLEEHLKFIGMTGYGANKSRGLGKFMVTDWQEFTWDSHKESNSYITLSPCFLTAEDEINTEDSYYAIETIFGKHGNTLSGKQHIKNPVTLISSHALITPHKMNKTTQFIGHGLGGNGEISSTIRGTVQQGYSIVVPIYVSVEEKEREE